MLQAQVPLEDPFFTNNLLGLAKIVATIVAPIIAFLWALLRGPFQKKDDDLDRAINGVGHRVNKLEERTIALESFKDESRIILARHGEHIQDLKTEYSKVVAAGEAIQKELNSIRLGLSEMITKEGRASRDQIHQLELKLAKMAND
jgi:chromosome segregation ATPase